MNTYNEKLETFLPAYVVDTKKRQIGFIVGLVDNGVNFYAWVQNARYVNNEWFSFGATQKGKDFTSQKAAVQWAYQTANKRIAKLKSK